MALHPHLAVAQAILIQLGGHKFIAMTGSTNFAGDDYSLSMKLIRNRSKANYLRITLNSMDTYDMEFIRVWNSTLTVMVEKKGMYSDMLQNAFREVTGLDTSL